MPLESIVNKSFKKTAKLLLHSAIAVATGTLSYTLVGLSGPLTGLAFAAGSAVLKAFGKDTEGKSKGLEGIIKDFTVGSLVGMIGVGLYDYAAQIFPQPGFPRGIMGVAIGNPIFTGAYIAADYTVKNDYNPSGLSSYFRQNYWPVLRDSTVWLGLPIYWTINGYGIPYSIRGFDLRGYPTIVMADMGYRIVAGLAQSRAKTSPMPAPYYAKAA